MGELYSVTTTEQQFVTPSLTHFSRHLSEEKKSIQTHREWSNRELCTTLM